MLNIKIKLSQRGFSLIELMVAVVILAMVVFGIFLAFSTGFQGMADARDRTVATNYAREAMEDIKNMDFEYISSVPLELISGTKYKREVSVEENVEESLNLKKITVRVIWEKRNGDNISVETSMLINKIEFLPGGAAKLLLYVTPYNIIFPHNDYVNIIAVVKDAKGNTVTSWDENITFTIESINPSGDISGYLKDGTVEVGINVPISIKPVNGIATIMLYSGKSSTLDADEIGNINVSAKTSSAETGELSDSVDVKVTLGAVKINLISKQDSIKINTIKINTSTEIIATLVNAKGDPVEEGEAEIIFNVSGEGTLTAPLTKSTKNQQTSITLTASNTPGIATVTASADNLLPGTIDIYVTGPPKSIYVEVNPNYIYMDQTADIIVTLKDINGITVNAESDVTITFSLSPESDAQGDFTPNSITIPLGSSTNNITANSIFFTPTGTGNGIVQATATAAGLTAGEAAIIVADTLVADHIDVSAAPSGLKVLGDLSENNTSIITAVIKSLDGITVTNYNQDVTFTTDKGSFSDDSDDRYPVTLEITSPDYNNGIATVKLYSKYEEKVGIATVTVTSGSLSESVEVGFYSNTHHIKLVASPQKMLVNGDTCEITATIVDEDGTNIYNYNEEITFTILEGWPSNAKFTFINTSSLTKTVINGESDVDLTSQKKAGTVKLKASSFNGTEDILGSLNIPVGISVTLVEDEQSPTYVSNEEENSVSFDIEIIGADFKLEEMQVYWNSLAGETLNKIEIKSPSDADSKIVYDMNVDFPDSPASSGELIDVIDSTLSTGISSVKLYFNADMSDKSTLDVTFNPNSGGYTVNLK